MVVVGWAVSAVNDRHLTPKAVGMALKRRCPEEPMENRQERGLPQAPHPSSISLQEEKTENKYQHGEPVH